MQLALLVDFAHKWNSDWVERMEETGSKVWAGMLLFFTFLMYGLAVAGIVCMYVYFTNAECKTNKFVISLNLILCVIGTALAIHPKAQERQHRSGTGYSVAPRGSNKLLAATMLTKFWVIDWRM